MTAYDLIKQVQSECQEWLEMSENPEAFFIGVLANKIIQLQDKIEYLEKRLEHVPR
jgi:hypothetical protein